MNRRDLLEASLALAVGTSGCLGLSTSTNSKTTTTPEPTSSGTSRIPSTSTTEESESTRSSSTTTATEPTNPPNLNRTPHPVSWQFDTTRPPLGDNFDPRAVLMTNDNWQERVNEAVLNDENRSFLSNTDYGTESVVAFQASLPDYGDRLILHSVEGVGTQSLTLVVEDWGPGPGANVEVQHLLLVRVPNRGTEPTSASVTLRSGGTVSAGE